MEDNLERDIYHRLGGIEAKLDDVRAIRQTANDAEATATQALRMAESHEDELKEMRQEGNANRRWLIGTIAGSILSFISVIVAIIALF